MSFITDDLNFAKVSERAVEIRLLNGEEIFSGVHDVNEDEGFVSLYAPQVFGDDATRRKVGLDLIASVTVTDVEYKVG